ncbi:hypothetical protein HSBAA_16190 [Vreelandella sulfidaeris]|uniref:Carbohydrate ABC transporter permease n=1 Tax=Vreelandella sulfidaeris TaxID=115553 RepID=A0A455U512_9GAMM|nr:hypothetical protein HSBAA_16190 [Halomonas sulfidaeris]
MSWEYFDDNISFQNGVAPLGIGVAVSTNQARLLTVLGWSVALVIFFPIFWMILTGFKTESAAIADPTLIFSPTLESYQAVQERSGYASFALNSVAVAFGSTF